MIGGFPSLNTHKRVTIPAIPNPMDKSTVVSIFPKHIKEIKPTIQPGVFVLEPGTLENPFLLTVGTSSWWKETDPDAPLLEIPNGSMQVADSIVKDYCNGLLGCNMSDIMPGLFWLPGEVSIGLLKSKYKKELDDANTKQNNYFKKLVTLADAMWAKTNGSPLVINNDMRMAAERLNLKDKPWNRDFLTYEKINCRACGSMISPDYPICPTCKAIHDVDKAAKLGIKFAV